MCFRSLSAVAVACALMVAACEQERNRMAVPGKLTDGNQQTELVPGPSTPVRVVTNPLDESNDETLGRGKELYNQMNCSGCHAAGGGAIGPALMDSEWIYGSSPGNIYWTIVEGRPQGMPSFRGRLSDQEVWHIVAYVRSLSGLNKAEEKK